MPRSMIITRFIIIAQLIYFNILLNEKFTKFSLVFTKIKI